MKRSVLVILGIGLLLYPLVSFASYIIHLKSGHSFQTELYWEEGGEIKFKRYGGVIGIRKELVKDIEEIKDLPDEKGVEAKQQVPDGAEKTGGGSGERGTTEDTEKEGDKQSQDIDVAYYKNQKQELMARYKEAKKKLNEAILSRNKRATWEAKKETKEIHEKLAELIRELKSASKGVLPDWWHAGAKSQKPDH